MAFPGLYRSNLKSWDSNSVLSQSEALLSLLCLRVKTLPYHSANRPGRGNLRTSCLHSSSYHLCDVLPLPGPQFPYLENRKIKSVIPGLLPSLSITMLRNPSFDRYMVYLVCKCQQCPEPFSTQLFGKRRARGGHLGPASGKSTKAWR